MKYLTIIALAAAWAIPAHAGEPRFRITPIDFNSYSECRDDYYQQLRRIEEQNERIQEQNDRIERQLRDANDARIIDSH